MMKKLFLFHFALIMFLSEVYANDATKDLGGLPNVSVRSESTSGNWDVSADFLVWYASEETASIWASDLHSILQSGGILSTFEATDVSFDWDFGFRVGVGYHFEYDKWDTQLQWSWFRTDVDSSIPVAAHIILPEFWGGFINGNLADSAEIDWSLLFNMFDWDLGRSYWVSKSLIFRPFIGVKGGWIHQSIHSKWHVVAEDREGAVQSVDYNANENLKNNFWGVGPFGGINTKWKLGSSNTQFFNLFGDFSVATLWGRWIIKDHYKDTTLREISTNLKNSDLGALMLRGFMGMGWDTDINKGLSHFAIRIGYEMQIWFNQLRIPTFQMLRLHGDLTLQGGTLNCRLDF